MCVNKHPIDYNSLEQGQLIPRKEVAKRLNIKEDSNAYILKALAFAEDIENNMEAIHGKTIFARSRKLGIYILTNEESVEYQDYRFHNGAKTMRKMVKKGGAIDPTDLTTEIADRLHNNVSFQRRLVAALSKEIKVIRTEKRKEISK